VNETGQQKDNDINYDGGMRTQLGLAGSTALISFAAQAALATSTAAQISEAAAPTRGDAAAHPRRRQRISSSLSPIRR
jgi:hypothetical protein